MAFMVLDGNRFREGCKFGTFSNLDGAHVVLKNFAVKFRLWIEKLEDITDFLHIRFMKGKVWRID
jgi:hypothetical protein